MLLNKQLTATLQEALDQATQTAKGTTALPYLTCTKSTKIQEHSDTCNDIQQDSAAAHGHAEEIPTHLLKQVWLGNCY